MQVGSIVRMIDDRHNVLGIVTKVVEPCYRKTEETYYKVVWLDGLCDSSYCDEDGLEVVCK